MVGWDRILSLSGLEFTVLAHTHTHTCRSDFNETTPHWYIIPRVISVYYTSSSVSHLPLTVRLSFLPKYKGGERRGEKNAYVAPYPNFRNKSALWTSVPACIMDDVAEGPRYREGLSARKR